MNDSSKRLNRQRPLRRKLAHAEPIERLALQSLSDSLVVLDLADRHWSSLSAGGIPIADCSESVRAIARMLSSETPFSERAEVPPTATGEELLSELARTRPSADERARLLARMSSLGIVITHQDDLSRATVQLGVAADDYPP